MRPARGGMGQPQRPSSGVLTTSPRLSLLQPSRATTSVMPTTAEVRPQLTRGVVRHHGRSDNRGKLTERPNSDAAVTSCGPHPPARGLVERAAHRPRVHDVPHPHAGQKLLLRGRHADLAEVVGEFGRDHNGDESPPVRIVYRRHTLTLLPSRHVVLRRVPGPHVQGVSAAQPAWRPRGHGSTPRSAREGLPSQMREATLGADGDEGSAAMRPHASATREPTSQGSKRSA